MESRIRTGTGVPTYKAAEGALYLDGSTDTIYKQTASPSGSTWLPLADVAAKKPVFLATATALPAHAQTGSGPGMRLTASANGALSVDGATVTAGKRILNKHHTTRNGIFTVIQPGSVSTPWILERAADFDDSTDVFGGIVVVVKTGSTQADTVWYLSTNDPITVDTTTLTFVPYVQQLKITGTTNRVSVTNTALGVQLSAPQDLATTSAVQFQSAALTQSLEFAGDKQLGFDAGQFDDVDFEQYSVVGAFVANYSWITGLRAGGKRMPLWFHNNIDSTAPITLMHEDTSSADENRIRCHGGRNVTLMPGEGAFLLYDRQQNRWYCETRSIAEVVVQDPTDFASPTSQDVLAEYIIAAGKMQQDGDSYNLRAWFQFNTTGTNEIFAAVEGNIVSKPVQNSNSYSPPFEICIDVKYTRIAADTMRISYKVVGNNNAQADTLGGDGLVRTVDQGGMNYNNNIKIHLLGDTPNGAGEITRKQLEIEFKPWKAA